MKVRGLLVMLLMSLAVCSEPDLIGQMIDGSVNPELIPDRAAYMAFFHMLPPGNLAPESEAKRVRGYLALAKITDDSEVQRVLIFATSYFQARLDGIHKKFTSKEITLAESISQKEQLGYDLMRNLAAALGAETAKKIDSFVKGRIKSKMNYTPHDVLIQLAGAQTVYTEVYPDSGWNSMFGSGVTDGGVTDECGDSGSQYWESATTITSPSGRFADASSGWQTSMARADVSLPWDDNDLGTYLVNTTHSKRCLCR